MDKIRVSRKHPYVLQEWQDSPQQSKSMSPEFSNIVSEVQELVFLSRNDCQLQKLCSEHQNVNAHMKMGERTANTLSVLT